MPETASKLQEGRYMSISFTVSASGVRWVDDAIENDGNGSYSGLRYEHEFSRVWVVNVDGWGPS